MKGDIRCFEGGLWRHDPQPDDPELETRVGSCPHCDGLGCEELDRRAAAAVDVTGCGCRNSFERSHCAYHRDGACTRIAVAQA